MHLRGDVSVREDLKKFCVEESRRYGLALDRSGWRNTYWAGLKAVGEARGTEGHVLKAILAEAHTSVPHGNYHSN